MSDYPHITSQDTQAQQEIARNVDAFIRGLSGTRGQFYRCRAAGQELARAVYAYTEDSEAVGIVGLANAWEAFMRLDSGNFAAPVAGQDQPKEPTP